MKNMKYIFILRSKMIKEFSEHQVPMPRHYLEALNHKANNYIHIYILGNLAQLFIELVELSLVIEHSMRQLPEILINNSISRAVCSPACGFPTAWTRARRRTTTVPPVTPLWAAARSELRNLGEIKDTNTNTNYRNKTSKNY